MKKCVHCGVELSDDLDICIKCGCYADEKCILTFTRPFQFFLINPPINVKITGKGVDKTVSVENDESIDIKLERGIYNLHCFASIRKTDLALKLEGNAEIQLSWNRLTGKLEVKKI